METRLRVKKTGDTYDLNTFFESSADMLCIAGFDGFFKRINPATCTLLGYSEEELKSKPITDFVLPDDRDITDRLRANLSNGKPLLNFENRYVTKSGEVVWLSWTSIPDTSRDLVYAIAKNVTHSRKVSDDRNRLISNLTKTNSDLKRLTFSTSHDLRAPLGNILGILSILDYSKINDKETLELIEMLQISAEKMRQTLDRQIDSIKESEKVSVDVELISLEDCLKSTVGSIKSHINLSQTSINCEFEAFDSVMFNKTYMESIFLNLITNSIRYSKQEAPPSIHIKTVIEDGTKKLVFSDNGLGMDMDMVKGKIFGFNQTFHNNKESKGIGLYLVSNHVRALGGTIAVDSEPGDGTTFTISFAN
jgi:PAS domain S-box-containing protein